MRTIAAVACAGVIAVAAIAGENPRYVVVVKDQVAAYRNLIRDVYEQPAFVVSRNDYLTVVEASGDRLLVQDQQGRKGWVDLAATAPARATRGYRFVDEPVIPELDNPRFVYVPGEDYGEDAPMRIDRSFAEALRENTDEATVQRSIAGPAGSRL